MNEKMSSSLTNTNELLRRSITELVNLQCKQCMWLPVYNVWFERVMSDLDTIDLDTTSFRSMLDSRIEELRKSMTRIEFNRYVLRLMTEYPSPLVSAEKGIRHMTFLKRLTRPIESAERQKFLLDVAEKLGQHLAREITQERDGEF